MKKIKRQSLFNNVDYEKENMHVPNFEKLKDFACKVADALPHVHLIALDIMLDEDNLPVLIEYNIRGFSAWLFQFTNGSAFGIYTDEIIEYCKAHKKDATRISVTF